jgi:hypothetical protein
VRVKIVSPLLKSVAYIEGHNLGFHFAYPLILTGIIAIPILKTVYF